MPFTIAIVGRPNVGKSTLFNRLAGKRLALVDKTPGLTRDRKEAIIELAHGEVTLIDTAGLEDAPDGSIQQRMRAQTEAGITEADLVLFTIDARAGVTPADELFADIVRQSGTPVMLLVNKCEGRAGTDGYYDAFRLGFGEPIAISAEHGEGIGELMAELNEALLKQLEQRAADGTDASVKEEPDPADRPLRLAVIGRPNAGKSTLVNALLGEERMITGPEAGLTRDAVSTLTRWGSRDIALYDTAGLRRRSRIRETAEKLSAGDALRATRYAEIVILMLDAEAPFEKQDLTLGAHVVDEGRGLVIAVNKWDLVRDKQKRLHELREMCERLLPQVRGVPLVTISALEKRGLDRLMKAVEETEALWNTRLPTSGLNRWLSATTERHPPPAVSGKRIRLRYITQSNARPPTFVVFCSRPDDLPTSYERYLVNSLREHFELPGVPIRIHMRKGKNPYADKD